MRTLRPALAGAWPGVISLAITAAAHHGENEARQSAHPTAAATGPVATLQFSVRDESAKPIPCRLTFIGENGARPNLFPNPDAAPNELAVRLNAIYSVSGQGAVTVPPGSYTIYASRGMEWSIASQSVELQANQQARFDATLRHEVDTTGWISGDFHLHTLTHSGHGDANLKERVITFVGEGLEFAVATDHNHNTDYEPTVRELGLEKQVSTVCGNEVTTSIGHFNAFPLDPQRPIPPPQSYDANTLFKLIRQEPNRYGVTPVIQLNHPRWGGIDYFTRTGLDPVSGLPRGRTYSAEFDTIELFNENEGWGYLDDDVETKVNTADGKHCVLHDWYNLLNRGHRYAAVGNSDSHTVIAEVVGYPRNYVRSRTDDPAQIKPADVAAALRKMQVFTTIGPFVSMNVGGVGPGESATARNGQVELDFAVQAASWIGVDRAKIVVNGDVVEAIAVQAYAGKVERIQVRKPLTLDRDSWVALLVEGDKSLAPIVHDQDRPILPFAVVNPVFVDADGDGKFSCLADQASRFVQERTDRTLAPAELAALPPSLRMLTVLAAADQRHRDASPLVLAALRDPDRRVKLAAARAAETLAQPVLLPELESAYLVATDDPYQRIALLGAMKACGAGDILDRMFAFVESCDPKRLKKYGEDLEPYLPGDFVRQWQAVGFFPRSSDKTPAAGFGPEKDGTTAAKFKGKGDEVISWKPIEASKAGYLDLRQIDPRKGASDQSVAYAQTYVYAPTSRPVRMTLGTDDGARVWVNDALIHEDRTDHGASPLQTFAKANLRQGWNRVVFEVSNGGGGFGLYFRLLDAELLTAPQPE